MEILAMLIPLSLVLVMLIAAVFWWAVKHDQFDDLEAYGARILLDDDAPSRSNANAPAVLAPEPTGGLRPPDEQKFD